jgi:HD-GYP domain-containing protein (c-di-GMP phosphodiesterase class II)
LRRVLLDRMEPGMKLGRTIYTPDGRVLLGEGVLLKASYIERLRDLDISSIYINDEISADIDIPDILSDPVRQAAVKTMREITDNVRIGNPPDLIKARQLVNMLVDDLFAKTDAVIQLFNVQDSGSYLIGHMINVAVMSILTGVTLGYDELRMRDLGVGAFLHDMGMFLISESTYHLSRALTPEEFKTVQQHAKLGFDALRGLEMMNTISANVAFQHHERFNGSGYPRGLSYGDIHEFARIVAIADVYDALTTDRPYRAAILPGHAVEYLVAMAGTAFDPELVEAFTKRVAFFPVGSIVVLNSGEKAIVIYADQYSGTRPIIRIFADASYHKLQNPIEMDLKRNPTVFIVEVLEEYQSTK